MKTEHERTPPPTKNMEEVHAMLSALEAQANQLRSLIVTIDPTLQSDGRSKRPVRVDDSVPLDAAPTTPAPLAPPKPRDIRERIEEALTRESLDTQRLAKLVGDTFEKVNSAINVLRADGLVYNVGFEDHPIWTWKVGNDADTATLIRVVRRLISERPMFLRDLVRATGAKESRVSGAVVEICRMDRVVDMGGGGHAKQYFLVGDRLRDASLAPKTRGGKPIKHGGRRGE